MTIDGRFLLRLTGLILVLSGLLVIVQSVSRHFFPHLVCFAVSLRRAKPPIYLLQIVCLAMSIGFGIAIGGIS
ncbi:hypothetical protein OKW21_000172 [Catalinimonas alkaloidigena]|nr:hypothetical protein [Catalinimonas alkaloidigena]